MSKNPAELTGCASEATDPAATCDLIDNDDYAETRLKLEDRWRAYASEAAPSTFAWADDGPLANPELFGDVWSPWRDADDVAKAHFVGVAGVDEAPASAASTAFAAVAGTAPSASSLLFALGSFLAGVFVSRRLGGRRGGGYLPVR